MTPVRSCPVAHLGADADAAAVIARLREYGAVIIDAAVSPQRLSHARRQLDPWFACAMTGSGTFFGRRTKRFSGVFAKAPATASLAGDRALLALVETILTGRDQGRSVCDRIQLNLTQAIAIEPGEPAQILHRDEGLFPFARDYEVMANVMFPLDPFTPDNGATRIVPRSNRDGALAGVTAGAEASACASPGDAIIWLGSTLHGGGANRTRATRRGLVFSYCLGWLAQAEKLLLSTPPPVARALPARVQKLIGYQVHRPNLGWIEGRDPREWLHNRTGVIAAARDNLSPAAAMALRARARAATGAAPPATIGRGGRAPTPRTRAPAIEAPPTSGS